MTQGRHGISVHLHVGRQKMHRHGTKKIELMLEETKQYTVPSDASTTGILKSVSNQVLTAVGVGVLALPKAITGSGWALGILLLLGTWALSQGMMHLLWKSIMTVHMRGVERIESYGDLGGYAYGNVGRYAVAFATYTGLTAICVIIMILSGSSLFQLTGALSQSAWIRIAALILLPLSWLPTLKEVGILSIAGVVAVGAVGLVVLIGAIMADGDYRQNVSPVPASLNSFAMSFLEFMNSYTIAPVIPTIILGMKDPSRFPTVSMLAFAVISACFAVIGFAGYLGWCDLFLNTNQNINEILASTSSTALSVICQIGILVVSLSHFLVMFNPVALLSDKTIACIPGVSGKSVKFVAVLRILGRSALVGIMLAAALFVPSFFKIIDIVASTVVLPLQVIFPILFYCAICKDEIHKMSSLTRNAVYTLFALALAIALVAMGFGMYNVIHHW